MLNLNIGEYLNIESNTEEYLNFELEYQGVGPTRIYNPNMNTSIPGF